MKRTIISTLIAVTVLSGCNYLDIVPDERPLPENTYQNPAAAQKYLYSCYAPMPDPRSCEALDKFSAAEICFPVEKSDFITFPRGLYSPSSPSLVSAYYNNIWRGIRQCYQFLDVVDLTPNMEVLDLQYYKAEATLLIAYYHFLAFRAFGPTMIIRDNFDPLTPIDQLPERSSCDEVVDFIHSKINEALEIGLAERHDGKDYGRFTRYVALALKAKVDLYAASPLFNSNDPFYKDLRSPIDNRPLFPEDTDIKKWQRAEESTRFAMSELLNAGYRLYTSDDAGTSSAARPTPVNPAQRAVRYATMDNEGGTNPELIMVDTRKEVGGMGIHNQSTPIQIASSGFKSSWSTVNPTLQMVEFFYTKNGLPIDEDTEYDFSDKYAIRDMPANFDGNNYTTTSPGRTLRLHLDREPRFYAWICFHNGFFEMSKYNGKVLTPLNKKAQKLMFREQDENGKQGRTANYSGTGYLNKKFVHPTFQNGAVHYPYPVIRMAEMYLNLAEILIEEDLLEGGTGRLNEAKQLINEVRRRAGIPEIDEAWKKAKHPEKAITAEGLLEIVRRERQIEFYLENQRFWDLRRWKKAEVLGEKVWGMNIEGATDETFFVPTELPFIRTFKQANYLMPIPMDEANKVPNILQNPGY